MNRTIEYNGKEYPTLTFEVTELDYEITIASIELSNAMDGKYENLDTEECDIDDEIYFYVKPHVMELPIEEICKSHLDEPFTFKP